MINRPQILFQAGAAFAFATSNRNGLKAYLPPLAFPLLHKGPLSLCAWSSVKYTSYILAIGLMSLVFFSFDKGQTYDKFSCAQVIPRPEDPV